MKTVVLSSLYRVFPEVEPSGGRKETFSCLRNEPLSVQVAFRWMGEEVVSMPFNLRIESDLPITLYSEGAVPLLQTSEPNLEDRVRVGMVYDMLLPKTVNPSLIEHRSPWGKLYHDGDKTTLHAVADSWKAIWLTINEDGQGITAGEHTVTLKLYSRSHNELVGQCRFTVDVVDAELPV